VLDTWEQFPHLCKSLQRVQVFYKEGKVYACGGLVVADHAWFSGCPTSDGSSQECCIFLEIDLCCKLLNS
jgi:hypothetical protein